MPSASRHCLAQQHRHRPIRRLFALTVLTGLVATSASAQVSPALDRFSFSLGAFNAKPSFGARVNSQDGAFDTGDVPANSVTVPRVSADLLIFDSQGISFDYYRYKKTYSASDVSNFRVGPTQVNASIDARLETTLDFGKLAYKWWLGSGNTVLGLGAGAAYYRIEADARASANVNGTVRNYAAHESEDAIAPLLELGVRHAFTPDLRVFLDTSGVWKNGGKLHGSIYNAAVGAEWFPIKNVGLVLSYSVSDITLNRDDAIDSRLRVKVHGPSAFVKVRF